VAQRTLITNHLPFREALGYRVLPVDGTAERTIRPSVAGWCILLSSSSELIEENEGGKEVHIFSSGSKLTDEVTG
jgi:hypothetical protein